MCSTLSLECIPDDRRTFDEWHIRGLSKLKIPEEATLPSGACLGVPRVGSVETVDFNPLVLAELPKRLDPNGAEAYDCNSHSLHLLSEVGARPNGLVALRL
ncbi:hypothetical protein GCM10027427_35420 [Pseudoclavibacter terrae]